MMYPPYTHVMYMHKQKVEYFYSVQLGAHFRAAVGHPCPAPEQLDAARAAGRKITLIETDAPETYDWPEWTYPYGSERALCIGVDKNRIVRRLYLV
jgi:hypothetical protein